MYKLAYLSLCFVLLISNRCQKQESRGLVAFYPFNSNTLDESGYKNHGTVYNTEFTADRFGKSYSALKFDGETSNFIALVSHIPTVDSPQSISLWFKINQSPDYIDSLGADNIIALVDSAKGIGVQIGYRAPGYKTLGLDAWYWGGRTILESQQPTVGKWHHCVYTFDDQTHFFYLDGKQTAQSSVKPQSGKPNILMFGNYPGGDQYFAGSIDDVRIYSRALLPAEIKLLYNKKE